MITCKLGLINNTASSAPHVFDLRDDTCSFSSFIFFIFLAPCFFFLHCVNIPIVFISAIDRPFRIIGEMHLLLFMNAVGGSSISEKATSCSPHLNKMRMIYARYLFHWRFPWACQRATEIEGTPRGRGRDTCKGSDCLPQ